MTPERWRQITALFHVALANHATARSAFLDEACAGDPTLRSEVDALLSGHDGAGAFGETRVGVAGESAASGTTLGTYRIDALLGRGGMGTVFLAFDTRLHRRVALKVMSEPSLSPSRLLREARNAAGLNHPNVCAIHEVGNAGAVAFIAMEHVDGRSLRDRLDEGALSVEETLRYGLQAAQALEHAHEHGVVHCDFKAANVIVSPSGQLKIVDFGLARRSDELMAGVTATASSVAPGRAAGTPCAMAPEQVRGDPADPRSDIWALGVLLYEMVTGATPFKGATAAELFSSILRDAPARLPGAVPAALSAVIERCLEKVPERRFQHAREVGAALHAIQADAVTPWLALRYRLIRRPWMSAAVSSVAVVAVLLGINVGGMRDRVTGHAPPTVPIRLAVLPLEDLSGHPGQEYFAAGIHESLITDLARIGNVRVTARSSSLRYRGTQKSVSEIAKELNVDAVLTGSVAWSGDRVRITAQLIDAATERYLWANRYDRALHEVLSLQNEIITAIAREVRLQLTPEEQGRLSRARPVNPDAYEAYLRGVFFVNQLTPEGTERGMALLHEAVEKDPSNPLPYAHLAIGYSTLGHGPSPPPDAFTHARAAARKALELDDTVAQAHEVLAELTMYADDRTWDWPMAEQGLQRAIALNPTLAQAYAHYGWYLILFDRWDEGFDSMKRAQEVDPLTPLWPAWQASLYWWSGRHDEAIREAQKSLALNPRFPVALSVLGRAYSAKAMHKEAIAAQEKAVALNPAYGWSLAHAYALAGRRDDAMRVAAEFRAKQGDTWGLALVYAALGAKEEALKSLEGAFEQHDGNLPWVRNLPAFAALRNDVRFQALLRRMHLPS